MQFFAPAKINLYLHIVGKLENGYHELESFVVFSKNFGDIIEISLTDDNITSLEIDGYFGKFISTTNNLVLDAAEK